MAQRSVIGPTTYIKKDKQPFKYQWMRYFFTEDTSYSQRPIIELQRRAAWIAVAILFQASNEIPHVADVSALIPFFLLLGSFWALWMALRPAPKQVSEKSGRPQVRTWQRVVLILTFLVTIAGMFQFGRGLVECFSAPQFSNDGTSLDTNAAILLVQGRNPYSDSNIPELFRRFDINANWTTPLRQGQFADRLDYPSMSELQSILNTSLKSGDVPEFEAKVSYPALSFLTLVPFALFQNYNVLPFYMLSYLLIVILAWRAVKPELRPWVILLAIANVPMWASTIGGNLDIFYTLLLIVSWLKRDQRWISAIFFGLALATKQIAWYFVPFYLIMALQHYGWKEACYRLAIAGGIGLAINLPFIMWDYHSWFAGVMAPIADPMFPMGVGLITLSTSHLLPYFPTWVYTALELGGMLSTFVWYWRICRSRPEAAMLLAVLPLFLAWRSLSSYFYCVAFPTFILSAAQMKTARQYAFDYLRSRKQTGQLPSTVQV
ncbi:glycosyltransferase family 87 protein [Dictyobacter kobayashii]|nr:glycosyltransferase 87 family protein [Dictyobacter kobayashii]